MPIINFEGPALQKEQKSQLAAKLTDAASEILPAIPTEAFVVIIKENSEDNVSTGGVLLSERPKKD